MVLFDEILLKTFMILLLGGMLGLVFIFIMHILMPKKVLKTYFKEPYFGPGEIAMFTGFPLGYMRTAMFMRALAFPSSGKKEEWKMPINWHLCGIVKSQNTLLLFTKRSTPYINILLTAVDVQLT